jgi:hypothetical protein
LILLPLQGLGNPPSNFGMRDKMGVIYKYEVVYSTGFGEDRMEFDELKEAIEWAKKHGLAVYETRQIWSVSGVTDGHS